MTKADIVDQVASATGHNRKESIEMVELVFSILKDTLEQGEEVKMSGFGKFTVKEKNSRNGRNPVTGEAMTIEARRILTFKPSACLKERINS